MSIEEKSEKATDAKPSTTLPGTVEKIIKSPDPNEPETAEIVLRDAEPLYQEIRIDNELKDEHGRHVRLKAGASVDVTIEADTKDTVKGEE